MTPELLKRIGETLYGPRWGSADFEVDLNVAERTIRRWLNGTAPIPVSIVPELIALCERLGGNLGRIIEELDLMDPRRHG